MSNKTWIPVEDGVHIFGTAKVIVFTENSLTGIGDTSHESVYLARIPDDLRFCRRKVADVPQPDWSKAPEKAMWWTVDATGQEKWHEFKPGMDDWDWGSDWHVIYGNFIDIPLGIDWRTLCVKRPEASDE